LLAEDHQRWVHPKRLGFSLKRTRPRHHKADQEGQEALKNLADEIRAAREAHPGARRGERPLAPVHHRFESLYVYGLLQPSGKAAG
jgi:Winged helix-turn helix